MRNVAPVDMWRSAPEVVAHERIDVTDSKSVTRFEIDAAVQAWAHQRKWLCGAGSEQWSRRLLLRWQPRGCVF
jgi:hypothetical protein